MREASLKSVLRARGSMPSSVELATVLHTCSFSDCQGHPALTREGYFIYMAARSVNFLKYVLSNVIQEIFGFSGCPGEFFRLFCGR